MAEEGEAPSAETGPAPGGNSPVRRRQSNAGGYPAAPGADAAAAPRAAQRRAPPAEVIDELAVEVKRTNLLDRVESQLADKPSLSRILFVFQCNDDRKVQSQVEQAFSSWRFDQSCETDLTGVLLFSQQTALHFLEGRTELLFQTLAFFHSLASEQPASAADSRAQGDEPQSPRLALVGPLRVLHFTELHGVRVSRSWCVVHNPGKPQGGLQMTLDSDCATIVFMCYRKFLLLALKVSGSVKDQDEVDPERLNAAYRKSPELMPSVDEAVLLNSKAGADLFFSYPDFERVFIAKFRTVLHSELLWPMPPPLSY